MGDATRRFTTHRPTSRPGAAPPPGVPYEPDADGDGQGHIIDLRDVPSVWPTMDGMVNPAPHAWRYHHDPDRLAVVDAFWRDLLWNVQLELDGVRWPGRADREGTSVLAAARDVARLWSLPSAEETLPAPSRRKRAHEPRRPG